ncbi:MAG: coproporphyrinogen dehydrogenase HemZ [Clostridia bacterium]|nr:coproporphyrinogen dehydrogenase HemZ [Clostridia bacterium]
MNYSCVGHDRKTAVSDMLISLLPDEKHFEATENADCITRAYIKDGVLHAEAEVKRNGIVSSGSCSEKTGNNEYERKRAESYAVKTALYKALLPTLEKKPAWGSLTGVTPAKPVRLYLAEGHTEKEAVKWLCDRYYADESRAVLCVAAAKAALKVEDSLSEKEAQIYVGIPFCPSKCAYCSFVSNDVKRWGHLIEPYFNSLLKEISAAGSMMKREGLRAGSIYVGGGTPTVLSAQQLEKLLSRLYECVGIEGVSEITVEAGRPDTITEEKLKVLSGAGVTRISINPQTMKDSVLAAVKRPHTAEDIKRAYYSARKVGDFIINCDLIAGLPTDDAEGLLFSVKELTDLAPENITVHCLARKKGAPLKTEKSGANITEEDLDVCYRVLSDAKYEPYYLYRQKYSAGGLENVGFCKNGLISRYNICMMEETGSVIALGSGGISKLYPDKEGKIIRICNPKYPLEYIERIDSIADNKLNINI